MRNKEIQEMAFCLMKTRNQDVQNCKPKFVIKRANCQSLIGPMIKSLFSGVSFSLFLLFPSFLLSLLLYK